MLDYEQIKEIINKIDGSSLRLFELEDKLERLARQELLPESCKPSIMV